MTNADASIKAKVANALVLIGRACGGRINYALNDDEFSSLLIKAERNGLLQRRPELDRAGGQVFDMTEKGWRGAQRKQKQNDAIESVNAEIDE